MISKKIIYWTFKRGDPFWVKKDQESQIEKIGCFSFDYIREDGKTKAKTTHHSILFFSTDFDQALSRAREEELRERAPQSIKVFNKMVPEEGSNPHIHGIPDPKSGNVYQFRHPGIYPND